MALDERSRHALYIRLETVLGAAEATTLMEHLPPTGWADVTTKRDLDHLEAITRADADRLQAVLRGEFEQLQHGLHHELARVETDLRADITRVETNMLTMKSELAAAMVGQTRTLLFSTAGLMCTLAALAFGAARLT